MYMKVLTEQNENTLLHSLKNKIDEYLNKVNLNVKNEVVLENLRKEMSIVVSAVSNKFSKEINDAFHHTLNTNKITDNVKNLKRMIVETIKDIAEISKKYKTDFEHSYDNLLKHYSNYDLCKKTHLYKFLDENIFEFAQSMLGRQYKFDKLKKMSICKKLATIFYKNINLEEIINEWLLLSTENTQTQSVTTLNTVSQTNKSDEEEKTPEIKNTNIASNKLVNTEKIEEKEDTKQVQNTEETEKNEMPPVITAKDEQIISKQVEKEIDKKNEVKVKLLNVVYAVFFLVLSTLLFLYARSRIEELKNRKLTLSLIIDVIKYTFKKGSIVDKIAVTLSSISLVVSLYILYSKVITPIIAIIKQNI